METAPSHGKEDEKGRPPAKDPHGFQEGKAQSGLNSCQCMAKPIQYCKVK